MKVLIPLIDEAQEASASACQEACACARLTACASARLTACASAKINTNISKGKVLLGIDGAAVISKISDLM